jgi:hypothetical protein
VRFTRTDQQGERFLALTPTIGRFWAFIAFVCDLYRRSGLTGGLRLLCNIPNAEQSYLGSFGLGWREPDHFMFTPARCLDPHTQVLHELPNPEPAPQTIEELIRRTDLRIENAYDHVEPPRSFNHPIHANVPAGGHDRFSLERYRGWHYV